VRIHETFQESSIFESYFDLFSLIDPCTLLYINLPTLWEQSPMCLDQAHNALMGWILANVSGTPLRRSMLPSYILRLELGWVVLSELSGHCPIKQDLLLGKFCRQCKFCLDFFSHAEMFVHKLCLEDQRLVMYVGARKKFLIEVYGCRFLFYVNKLSYIYIKFRY
jgi:hypothetical protein